MGTVTVITPGRLVRVEPDRIDADDIIEFAGALLFAHGWIKGDSGDEHRGWSIHGAVGEAARRATGAGTKDAREARILRDQVAGMVAAKYGQSEFEVNDTSHTREEAVGRLLNTKGTVV